MANIDEVSAELKTLEMGIRLDALKLPKNIDLNLVTEAASNSRPQAASQPSDDIINFKKPQNEMFKKLDGKIQKIVAAHSNLNKIYSLNDFSLLAAQGGPKKPSELPPRLPPPPPWVPKGTNELSPNWSEDRLGSLSPLARTQTTTRLTPLRIGANLPRSPPPSHLITGRTSASGGSLLATKPSAPRIDSAISRLHQRRNQQQQQRPHNSGHRTNGQLPINRRVVLPNSSPDHASNGPSTSSSNSNIHPTISTIDFQVFAQEVKKALDAHWTSKLPKRYDSNSESFKEYQEDMLAQLKKEITAVAKSAKFNFESSPPNRPKIVVNRPMLSKSSPQTLFNTIRRETSLLLNKRDQARPGFSLLRDQFTDRVQGNDASNYIRPQQINKTVHTVKVVIPPTEFQQATSKSVPSDQCENVDMETEDGVSAAGLQRVGSKLSYQMIKSKLRRFQEIHNLTLGRARKMPGSFSSSSSFIRRKSPQKNLDRIVDRLQAKWSPSPTDPDGSVLTDVRSTSLHQQILDSSASLLQSSRNCPTISTPTPIPVFRMHLSMTSKGGYMYGSTKLVNMKSKNQKRNQDLGLRLINYLERDGPQPTNETITIDEFARGLDLVRANDASLSRAKTSVSLIGTEFRMPVTNRPLRLRRLHGSRIHMPVSASYRATRRVGLK